MRIGFDAKRAFNNYSGLGNYSRYIISNFCRFYPENECFLYTPYIADAALFNKPKGTSVRMPEHGIWKGSGSLWRSFRLSHRLSKDAIDLYHGLSNELPAGIHKSRVKSIITIHDLIFLEHPELYQTLSRKIYERKARYGTRAASRIIAASEQTKQDIVRLLHVDESRISVVYQGCHRQFYSRVSEQSMRYTRKQFALPARYLLYVGTIEKRKNLLKIIEALHQGNIDFPLVVVGRKTSYFNLVKQYMERNGLSNIYFLDQVQASDLPAIYQGSSGFIYPSSYEGFGIPVLEALNSGVPVITTRGGCLEETAGKGGLLIDPENQEEMIHAIRQVLEKSSLRDRLVREGGAHALKFREEQTIPALYNLYLESLHD
ncbi:MAG: glycosyltransferase family 1 protein [Bacteroidales bacterium]|nr:glycosyltransferase family 1 protein [Bacteroidales bacterium]